MKNVAGAKTRLCLKLDSPSTQMQIKTAFLKTTFPFKGLHAFHVF